MSLFRATALTGDWVSLGGIDSATVVCCNAGPMTPFTSPFSSLLRVLCFVLCFNAATGSRAQPVLYEAVFDDSTDDWTAQEFRGFCPLGTFARDVTDLTRVSSGGAPGGFLRSIEPAIGSGAYWKAPPALVAAMRVAEGGTLSFQTRATFVAGMPFTGTADTVTVIGNGLTLIAATPMPTLGVWIERTLPLRPEYWRVGSCSGRVPTAAEFSQTLASATTVYLKSEYVTGQEIDDLDSIRLTGPTPAQPPCGNGWTLVDNAEPTSRWGHALALDTTRNVLVLYGGVTGETDTWEYPLGQATGRAWRRTATVGPGPRLFHAMAYDAARGKMVLVGGRYAPIVSFANTAATADVWEYTSNGTVGTWTKSSELLPQARPGGVAMTYDSARQTLVVYGGLAATAVGATDVVERNPLTGQWVSRSSMTNPGALSGHAMVFDSNRSRVVLLGSGTTNIGVWEWDGSVEPGTWTLVSATNPPSNRAWMTATYFPTRQSVIMTGGTLTATTDAAGVFEFKPATSAWTTLANIPSSGSNVGRSFHAAALDSVRNRLLVSAGLRAAFSPARDLLSLDPAANTWAVDRDLPNSPPPRVFAPAAFDSTRRRMVVAGGGLVMRGGNRAQLLGLGTFIYDGSQWVTTAGNLPDTVWKTPMVYVPGREEMYIYGGEVSNNLTVSAQVWKLTLSGTPTWSVLTTAAPPGRRALHACAYDSVRQRIVFFGGQDQNGVKLNDTWLLNPADSSWTQVTTNSAPSPRTAPAMTFDERRGVVVLFGGSTDTDVYNGSTWEFDGENWREVTPPYGNPAARNTAALVYAPDRGTCLLTGGQGTSEANSPGYDDVWEFDGTAWKLLSPRFIAGIVGTAYASHAYDTGRNRLIRFGGTAITFSNASSNPYYWYASGQTWEFAAAGTPVIRAHPRPSSQCFGTLTTMSVSVDNPGAVSFGWRRNGVPILVSNNPTANSATFSIPSAKASDNGVYECVVSNACGESRSLAAVLKVCVADFNCSGVAGVQDVFDFLTAWFANDTRADVNGSSSLTVEDVFVFLTAWFAGCP